MLNVQLLYYSNLRYWKKALIDQWPYCYFLKSYYPVPDDQVCWCVRFIAKPALKDSPRRFKKDEDFYRWGTEEYEPALQKLPQDRLGKHRQDVERMVVIKEACGNGYVSILASLIMILLSDIIHRWQKYGTLNFDSFRDLPYVLFFAFAVLLAILLGRMHFIHVRRQHSLMQVETPSDEVGS